MLVSGHYISIKFFMTYTFVKRLKLYLAIENAINKFVKLRYTLIHSLFINLEDYVIWKTHKHLIPYPPFYIQPLYESVFCINRLT